MKGIKRLNDKSYIYLGKEKTLDLVDGDVPRTFASLKIFTKEGPFYELLIEVLETYTLYRLDVGYVQGMSFIAAIISLFSNDSFSAFLKFTNLVVKYHFYDFFSFNMKVISTYYSLFNTILKDQCLEVWKIFQEVSISEEQYLFMWFQSVFLKVLPLRLSVRVWDSFLIEGIPFLFTTAIAIMKLFSPLFIQLMKSDQGEDVIKVLLGKNEMVKYWDSYIEQKDLFKGIQGIKFNSTHLKALKLLSNK